MFATIYEHTNLSGSVVRASADAFRGSDRARENATKGNSPRTRRQRARARETVINIADNKGSLNQIVVGPLAPAGCVRKCARAHVPATFLLCYRGVKTL